MSGRMELTLVVRSEVHPCLTAMLAAVPGVRARAGLLKKLADDGARLLGTDTSGLDRQSAGTMSGLACAETGGLHFDIRIVVHAVEYPHLHDVLVRQSNSRTRALLFKRLAEDAARWRRITHPVPLPAKTGNTEQGTKGKAEDRSLATHEATQAYSTLRSEAIPEDFGDGFRFQ
jgi:hypothetical protein